ncbi:MAG: aminotransferase class IV, partial [Planctomycetota bacterium]
RCLPDSEAGITLGMHLNTIDHDRISSQQHRGQAMVLGHVRQPDPACWPRGIKVRCRLHYYLADQIARSIDPSSVAILRDSDGRCITETSIANIAIVHPEDPGVIVSPPPQRVLPGITQGLVEEIAAECGVPWLHRPISASELLRAKEVLMMGTDGGLWPAREIIMPGSDGGADRMVLTRFREKSSIYQRLRRAWDVRKFD